MGDAVRLVTLSVAITVTAPFAIVLEAVAGGGFGDALERPRDTDAVDKIFMSPALLGATSEGLCGDVANGPDECVQECEATCNDASSKVLVASGVYATGVSPNVVAEGPPVVTIDARI